MSLRGFHLVFISFATLLCLSLAVWCFGFAPDESGWAVKAMGAFSAILAVGLPYYGVRFYRKAKNLVL